jgi:parallel beta-helix repeat protein
VFKNTIRENNDGVVLVHSEGNISDNVISQNLRSGVLTAGNTKAELTKNLIIQNKNNGV